MFSPVSGGHFNPVVSLAGAVFGGLPWRYAVVYIPAQIVGCVAGAVLRRHRPTSTSLFIAAQLVGAALAVLAVRGCTPPSVSRLHRADRRADAVARGAG